VKRDRADIPAPEARHLGRRNTGKSTFIICLAHGNATIVSEVAGARDSGGISASTRQMETSSPSTLPAVRNKAEITTNVILQPGRAERSIRRADVVFIFFDARRRSST